MQGTSLATRQLTSGGTVTAVPSAAVARPIVLDPYRSIVFPNRIRDLRVRHGFPKLLALATVLPDIPYIRLSKIERGEAAARADEIERIAGLLGIAPRDLLVDVEDPAFDIAAWAEPFAEARSADKAEEEFAVLLAAATRARRAGSAHLTIAAIERDFGLPPVVLSRIENATKTLNRWNDATVERICRFFDVADEPALRRALEEQYREGLLNEYVGVVTDPAVRAQKTRARVARLLRELEAAPAADRGIEEAASQTAPAISESADHSHQARTLAPALEARLQRVRLVPVVGAPLLGGLISPAETNLAVEAPRAAGPRAFGLRICRPTLGAGLPGNAIVIVDPDVFPASGGLAVVREDGNYRLLTIAFDVSGAMLGRSVNPSLELPLDSLDPADIMAVVSASFA